MYRSTSQEYSYACPSKKPYYSVLLFMEVTPLSASEIVMTCYFAVLGMPVVCKSGLVV